jgi:hypothetical protein
MHMGHVRVQKITTVSLGLKCVSRQIGRERKILRKKLHGRLVVRHDKPKQDLPNAHHNN